MIPSSTGAVQSIVNLSVFALPAAALADDFAAFFATCAGRAHVAARAPRRSSP